MGLKIYFGGSMRGGTQDQAIYFQIIKMLKGFGEVLTEFVGDKDYKGRGSDKAIHDGDVKMLQECDCVVSEVTVPSLGVGYEIGRAVAMNKPVLCLYRYPSEKQLSGMIRGAHDGKSFRVVDYTDVTEVPEILKEYFKTFPEKTQ